MRYIKLRLKPIFLSILLIAGLGLSFSFANNDTDNLKASLGERYDPRIRELAAALTLESNAQTRAIHDIDDVYNLLYNVFYNGSTSAYGALTEINNNLTYYNDGTNWTQAQLQAMTWGLCDDIASLLSTTEVYIEALYNAQDLTNSKLNYIFSAIEDTINIKWYSSGITYLGANTSYGDSYINSITNGNEFIFYFNVPATVNTNTPCLIRYYFPFNYSVGDTSTKNFKLVEAKRNLQAQWINLEHSDDYYFESTNNGIYLYMFDFMNFTSATYGFKIQYDSELSGALNPNYSADPVFIPFDTLDYQQIKTAFHTMKNNEANEGIAKLAELYASDDLITAKREQQAYENQVIQDFSGDGEAASTSSDATNVKNTSKALKQGLDTGGSVNNALGVFSTDNNNFWEWFTQPVKDSLDTTSTSPAYTTVYYQGNFSYNGNSYDINLSSVSIPTNETIYLNFIFSDPIENPINIYLFTGNSGPNYTFSIPAYSTSFTYSFTNTSFIRIIRTFSSSNPIVTVYKYGLTRSTEESIINFYDYNKDNLERGLGDGQSNSERR